MAKKNVNPSDALTLAGALAAFAAFGKVPPNIVSWIICMVAFAVGAYPGWRWFRIFVSRRDRYQQSPYIQFVHRFCFALATGGLASYLVVLVINRYLA